MGLDTGKVFKRPVFCPHCHEDYLFTLRHIAENQHLKCLGCGSDIDLGSRGYEDLVRDVKNMLEALDLVPAK